MPTALPVSPTEPSRSPSQTVVFADRAAQAVRSLQREDVAVVGDAAAGAGDAGPGRGGEDEQKR